MIIDTHCHIQFNAYKNDSADVIKRCAEKDVVLNAVGSQKDTSRRAVGYAEKYKNIYATVGLHPVHLFKLHVDEGEVNFESREENFDYEYYKNLAQNKKVVAIGECGLDLFHLPEGLSKAEILKKQKQTFISQYNLAKELNLPLVIHVREAHEELIDLLKSLSSEIRGVVHCYTSNWHYAQKYLGLGLLLGFTGIITFPPKKIDPQTQLDLLEVVEKCPPDRMLIETDAPYLAPQAYRGQRCEPWMVEEVAKKIAEVKGMSLSEVVMTTAKNAKTLFNL
jgi:TatD DNase family protein